MGPKEKGVHPRGYWYGEGALEEHFFDPLLAHALASFFKTEGAHSIVDFGCGLGNYVETFLNCHFLCEGYDGNPDTPRLADGLATTLDLSTPIDLGKQFDWVLSLEVGEHLPPCYERIFIENLDRHANQGIILSWAVKGQGGFGHFNEQSNDYIKTTLSSYGYTPDESVETFLREASLLPWFKDTLMAFRKKTS